MKPHRLTKPELTITEPDWLQAEREYGACNCGLTALAIMLGLPVMAVMPHIPQYKERHYTSPTMMKVALASLGVALKDRFPKRTTTARDSHAMATYGLVRIQWEGPWTAPGANPRWAYRQTHWVGSAQFSGPGPCRGMQSWVFDVNAGWQLFDKWESETVPSIIRECVPRATGGWFSANGTVCSLCLKLIKDCICSVRFVHGTACECDICTEFPESKQV